jgi:hypothetical protein
MAQTARHPVNADLSLHPQQALPQAGLAALFADDRELTPASALPSRGIIGLIRCRLLIA